MAVNLWKICFASTKFSPNLQTSVRNGHHLRGKPPGLARTLKQRLDGNIKSNQIFEGYEN